MTTARLIIDDIDMERFRVPAGERDTASVTIVLHGIFRHANREQGDVRSNWSSQTLAEPIDRLVAIFRPLLIDCM
jgi:poly(3-hydroxybutyrate) depolymerase